MKLPKGWVTCTMGEISSVVGGGTPKVGDPRNFDVNGFPWLTPADLSNNKKIHVYGGKRFLSYRGLETSSAKLMPKGTILFSSRAPIGYVAIAGQELSTNQGFKSFVCHEGIVEEYVYFYLKSAKAVIESMASGTTFLEISGTRARKIQIPLPPTNEQRRIAAKLKKLMPKVDACKERLDKIPIILKRFRQSVLTAACSGRLTEDWRKEAHSAVSGKKLLIQLSNIKKEVKVPSEEDPVEMQEIPREWAWSRCEYLCDKNRIITYGVIKLGPSVKEGIPILRSSDVRWLYIDNKNIKKIDKKIASEYKRTFLKGGEILVTVRGTLGGVAVVPAHMKDFNISREVAMLPFYEELNSKFLCYAIGSMWSQNWLSEVKKGAAYTGINIRDLKRLPIPIPAKGEQHEIVHRVEELFKIADQIEERYNKAKTYVDKLTQSILAKAFRGELVPQDPTDEPASELLKRIKEEKAKTEINTKISKRRRISKAKT